jgi:pimeloyl-ACP methyl ester carboxylesterase
MIILLHSSASSARQWDRLVETLQPRDDVRAVDLLGHGARGEWRGERPFTLADEAAAIAPMLDDGGAHLVGHSYGAAVALKLASLHPAKVQSVVAYEPVMFRWLIADGSRFGGAFDVVAMAGAMRRDIARDDDARAAQRFVDFWSGAGAWQSMPPSRQQAIAARIRTVLAHFDALFREPLGVAELARLRVPMLFLTGERTVGPMRCLAQLLRAALPEARHEGVTEAGHMGPITHAAKVNRRIESFLATQSGTVRKVA